MPLKRILLLGPLLLCTACGGRQEAPEPNAGLPIEAQWQESANNGAAVDGWLSSFNDATLDQLVAEGLTNNHQLQATVARVSEARARAAAAGARLKPTLDLALGATASGVAGNGSTSSGSAMLNASWEIDLWGRLSKTREAAVLDVVATEADLRAARQALAARITDAWFLAISSSQQLQVARRIRDSYQDSLQVTRDQHKAGVAKPGSLEIAEADLTGSLADIVEKEGAFAEAVRSLEVLIGRYPKAELAVTPTLPTLPGPVPAGLPSDLLERRPDIVAADRRVAAAFKRAGSARAARLPRLSITASGGVNQAFSQAVDPTQAIWNLGANLLAPILDGGRLKAEVDAADAQQQQALAAYRDTALSAFKDVESALASETILRRRLTHIDATVKQLDAASAIAKQQHAAGATTILEYNQVRLRAFAKRMQQVALQGQLLRARVAVHLALGGDFAQP